MLRYTYRNGLNPMLEIKLTSVKYRYGRLSARGTLTNNLSGEKTSGNVVDFRYIIESEANELRDRIVELCVKAGLNPWVELDQLELIVESVNLYPASKLRNDFNNTKSMKRNCALTLGSHREHFGPRSYAESSDSPYINFNSSYRESYREGTMPTATAADLQIFG